MNTFKILLAEIGYRKLNFVLSLLAVVIATAGFVAGPHILDSYSEATAVELSALQDRVTDSAAKLKEAEDAAAAELTEMEDQTRILMKDMGFNLTVLHSGADTVKFLETGLVDVPMDQEAINTLADDPSLTMVTHLVATLGGKVEFEGKQVRLVGYLPETPQPHRALTAFAKKLHEKKAQQKKTPMGYDIEPGTVQVGFALGEDREVGDTIEIGGKEFTIANILKEQGSVEDVTLAVHLEDAQALLDKPGQITQIMALECKCSEADLPIIRQQIQGILPDAHVIRDMSKANARANQRQMVQEKHQQIIATHAEALAEREQALADTKARREKIESLMGVLANVVNPLIVLACAVWIGLLALANVRERRTEIGILRAIGKGSRTIASLFLGKAVLLGLLGGAIGILLGTSLALLIGERAWGMTTDQFSVHYGTLLIALIGAPLLSALASYLPTLTALTQDPAVVLRDQ